MIFNVSDKSYPFKGWNACCEWKPLHFASHFLFYQQCAVVFNWIKMILKNHHTDEYCVLAKDCKLSFPHQCKTWALILFLKERDFTVLLFQDVVSKRHVALHYSNELNQVLFFFSKGENQTAGNQRYSSLPCSPLWWRNEPVVVCAGRWNRLTGTRVTDDPIRHWQGQTVTSLLGSALHRYTASQASPGSDKWTQFPFIYLSVVWTTEHMLVCPP